MQPFSLLVKPSGADCNLRCDYCFYLEKGALYPGASKPRMDHETLRAMLARYFETTQPVYSLVWQGGEPTLIGEDFFARVVSQQKELAPRGARIANAVQSNATLIKQGLAEHLGRYRFLVGCSIDGPADLHDAHRRTKTGRGSHARAVAGVRTLQRNNVAVNAVVLVSAANVASPVRVYRHLLDLGIHHLQFVPCVEDDDACEPQPYSINGRQWGEFLLSIFEQWLAAGIGSVAVRNFESALARFAGAQGAECRLCERCDQYLVVEHNGDVYPCDFFVEDGWRLGNVHNDSFERIRRSERYRTFAARKASVAPQCRGCEHFRLCMGDCPKFRRGPNGRAPSRLCRGWSMFYEQAGGRLERLARRAAMAAHAV